MKWSFVIQQKLKAAMLLGGIMVLIILATLLSRYNMQGIDRSFSSIYQDRLIPATTIIYLTENLYGKRVSLEKHLFEQDAQSAERVKVVLNHRNQSIDSLIRVFEKTYLVDQEAGALVFSKSRLKRTACWKTAFYIYVLLVRLMKAERFLRVWAQEYFRVPLPI
jgi:hypothetical protein